MSKSIEKVGSHRAIKITSGAAIVAALVWLIVYITRRETAVVKY